MKTDIKTKWVNALESGDYRQTTKVLRGPEGFCCLGVLTDLFIKETDQLTWAQNGKLFSACEAEDDYYSGWLTYLPLKVRDWADIEDSEFIAELASMNDTGATFPEIAKIIAERA